MFSTVNSSQGTRPASRSCSPRLDATSWDAIEQASGLSRSDIEYVGNIYARSERVIINYGMGITQHRHGTGNVQQIANLLMLRGNIGRRRGISPLRGHSNVQGDRTVGITEVPSDGLLNALARVFGFDPPRHKGHNAIEAVEAIRDGRSKALVCLGGNLAVAMSDPERHSRRCEISISRCTSPPSSIARIYCSRSSP